MTARRLVAALVLLALLCGGIATALARREDDVAGTPSGSTRAGTWVDRDGDGTLERGPGEALANRTELAPAGRPGLPLALLAQLTDVHVRDEESPARPALLDRLGPPFTSTFRPQEALTTQDLAAAVTTVDRLRPDAVLETGDLADNAQENELDAALATLRGGRVDPDSGARGYAGPQQASNPDPLFYRPDVDAPRRPGLLADAQRPFRSPGLRAPWYPLLGNHDVLVAGEVAPTPALRSLATGARLPVALDSSLRELVGDRRPSAELVDEVIARALRGRTRAVPPDPRRRFLTAAEVVARLRDASGQGGTGERLDYSFDVGASVRVIALDLVDRAGGSRGVVTAGQVSWLRRELGRAGRRWVILVSHQPLRSSAGGERVLAELDRSPRVVATLAGDTHRNSISPRRTAAGGYWLIETASLVDYPQQARALRLVETVAGGVALETWMLDTASTPMVDTSRQLAYLDAQGGRPEGFAGGHGDRNARLFR